MRLARIGALILFLQTPFGATRATIEGMVLSTGTGDPLSRVQVTLIPADGASQPGAENTTVLTGDDGKFAFKGVEPGSFRIAVARNGYVRQEYGQRLSTGRGGVVTLTPGQTMKEIVFHLVPAGNLNGVVRNPSGEPVAGFQVQLLRSTYGPTGQKTFQTVGADRTNDRGEYRLYWVTPGRYYLVVTSPVPGLALSIPGIPMSANEVPDRSYPPTFYPGTSEALRAAVINVAPGSEMNGVDVLLPRPEFFHVKGRVIDSATGRQPAIASVSIIPRGLAVPGSNLSASLPAYNADSGTFDLRDVVPGSYWVRATVSTSSANTVVTAGAAGRTLTDLFTDSIFYGRQSAQIPVEVSGSDVEGLVLAVTPGVSIAGRLSAEGRLITAVSDFESLNVVLMPAVPGGLANPTRTQPMSAEGTFTLQNVLPGEYVVGVQALPPDYYIKSARLGQTDVLRDPMLITSTPSGALDVVISPGAGRIEGTVTDDRLRAVAGITVVLVPELNRSRVDLYKIASTDAGGRFTMRGIPPGDYKVFAWEAVEPFAYFDKDFLAQYEQKGKSVRIAESSRENVDVGVIPATP